MMPESSSPSSDDPHDTLVALEPHEPTERSIDELGLEARAEFERLRSFLDLVDEPVTTQIARYRIERVLGRGGMGIVYLAEDPELHRSIALKLVRTGPFVDRERLHARLQREARVLAKLTHPNVVRVYDFGIHEGELFVAMEYVPGTNLRIWQRAEARSSATLLAAYLQAAHGLQAAHAAGIVHRDFKPDNALISEEGRVLVGDFGLASDRELVDEPQAGAVMGTLHYMAPERLRGELASPASDQFEFCVALWEALSGQRPFAGDDRATLLASMSGEPQGRDQLERGLRRVLERGLARAPEQRFADLAGLIAALEQRDDRARWMGGLGLVLIAGLTIGRGLQQEPCLVADRLSALEQRELALEQGTDAAGQAAQVRYEALVHELGDEATRACRQGEREPIARLGRWADVLELLVDQSAELPIARVLDGLADLESERDRNPPELIDPEVARLLDLAREQAIRGDLAEAEHATTQAAKLATTRSDQAEVALRQGRFAAARGRPKAALEHDDDAIANADAAGLDRTRLAGHLLAAPLALDRAGERERAKQHHAHAALLLERLDLPDDDQARLEHDEHEAMLASAGRDFERALTIETSVVERRSRAGEPLALAGSHNRLAKIHQQRAATIADPTAELAAAEAGYVQVLAELDRLGVGSNYPLRLAAQLNLGLLLWTDDASAEQIERVRVAMLAVIEAGPSAQYIPALQILSGLLIESIVAERTPERLVEAERFAQLLVRALEADDLAPSDRVDAWTNVASIHALRGDLVAFEAANAQLLALGDAALAQDRISPVDHQVELTAYAMQFAGMFATSNPSQARRYYERAAGLAEALPSEIKARPEVAPLVEAIAEANRGLQASAE